MTKISVIMPVYNTKEIYLREAIESILAQTFADFEFIILNDSPENQNLRRIIADYSDCRIKYKENSTNIGIPQSYNHLLDMAEGEYIAIMNHDDVAQKNRLSIQYKYMQAHPEVGILGSAYKKFGEINRFKVIKNPERHEEICALLLFKSSVHHPTMMLRRSIIEEHKIRYNENFISLNDRQLCYEFSKYSKLANIPDVLYKYRFHPNMTSKTKKVLIRKERAMFHKLWFAYNNVELDPEEIDIFDNYTTYGRQKVKDTHTLSVILDTLEKIVAINYQRNFLNKEAFAKVCSIYYMKRCINALYNGQLNISKFINKTKLPINKPLLKFLNMLLGWRK